MPKIKLELSEPIEILEPPDNRKQEFDKYLEWVYSQAPLHVANWFKDIEKKKDED